MKGYHMKVKILVITIGVIFLIIVSLWVILLFYTSNYFYSPPSDEYIVETIFITEKLGISSIEVLSSEGSGKSTSDPRLIEISVMMDSFPESV